ncbi:hypothetical protein [Neisseria meningitidis serogroup B]|uniref:Uncharacterized protein n=1 Tax=Neisseria meningitidis serogroup B TaxID=491 RepID=A0A0H5QBB7_NEIMI|nr:hypothetical protein [Neisseria meningitidis serogroup B]
MESIYHICMAASVFGCEKLKILQRQIGITRFCCCKEGKCIVD